MNGRFPLSRAVERSAGWRRTRRSIPSFQGGAEIGLDGFAQEQLRVSLGAEIARSFMLQGGATLTPNLGATAGFSGLNGSGLSGSVSTGLSLQAANGWVFDADLLFNLVGEGEKSLGAKVGVSTRF